MAGGTPAYSRASAAGFPEAPPGTLPNIEPWILEGKSLAWESRGAPRGVDWPCWTIVRKEAISACSDAMEGFRVGATAA